MSYRFTKAENIFSIKEQEFGAGKEIRFSKFISCIGLMAKNGNILRGVHLMVISDDNKPFNKDTADKAVKLLGIYEEAAVIGSISLWEEYLFDSYNYLISCLNSPLVFNENNGIFGGRIKDGNFQIYKNGIYVDIK